MTTAVSSAAALPRRQLVRSKGAGTEHWCTDFIGRHAEGAATDGPEIFLIEMSPWETILPHFHEIDQFQVFLDGGGQFGKENARPLAVHYADRYTGYGPIDATEFGYSYFVMHVEKDPGAIYRHRPGYQERLKPSKRRHRLAHGIALSTPPVLRSRRGFAAESLFEKDEFGDGMGAHLLRLGPGTAAPGLDTGNTSGQFYLVVNGSLERSGTSYPAWSTIHVAPGEAPLPLRAGPDGLEVLALQFPKA